MDEFIHHFMELVTDPAHLAFEVFTTFALEILILGLLWPAIRRRIRHEHEVIDAEHGVDHDDWFFDTDEDIDVPIGYVPTHLGETDG